MLCLSLFKTFFHIGLFTIGGGYAMIPLIESEVVNRRQWMKHHEFIDLLAVAQSLPGVFAVNMSVFIGYKLCGLRGSIISALGTVLPSFLIILSIALFFQRFKEYELVEAVFKGIRPTVVALIAVPVFNVARNAGINRTTAWIPIISTLLIWQFGVSPIWIIIAAGLGGYLWSKQNDNRMTCLTACSISLTKAGTGSAMLLFLPLFYTFFKIGLFGFGGGYAMLSMIQSEVVGHYGWISASEFTDIVAVSQMTPGPIGINSATYVGYLASVDAGHSPWMGIFGSALATFAVVLPSFLLMLGVSRLLLQHQDNPLVKSVFRFLRPAVVGLLASAALLLMNVDNFGSPTHSPRQFTISVALFIGAFMTVRIFKTSPIRVILIAGIIGATMYL